MVDGATLEKSCSERDLGFESLTLRQKPAVFLSLREAAFFLCVQRRLVFLHYFHQIESLFWINSFGVSTTKFNPSTIA